MISDDGLAAALAARAEALRTRLLEKVAENLSGAILQTRSGALKASVVADLVADAEGIVVSVGSVGIAYAAIQEFGGTTPPHVIEPVKAQALAFAGAGGAMVVRKVNHPGSRIPARAPFGEALAALRTEIAGGLKAAVREALGAD